MKIILASASPRRKELLEQLGLTFLVFPAQGEEKQVGDTPSEIVMNLAKQKAGEIYEKMIEAKVGEKDFPEVSMKYIPEFRSGCGRMERKYNTVFMNVRK